MRLWPLLLAAPFVAAIGAHVAGKTGLDARLLEAARTEIGALVFWREEPSAPQTPTVPEIDADSVPESAADSDAEMAAAGGAEQPQQIVLPERAARRSLGAELFSQRCAACHGWRAEGGPMAPAISARGTDPQSLRIALLSGAASSGEGFGDMPPILDLTEAEIEALAAHLAALHADRR